MYAPKSKLLFRRPLSMMSKSSQLTVAQLFPNIVMYSATLNSLRCRLDLPTPVFSLPFDDKDLAKTLSSNTSNSNWENIPFSYNCEKYIR